MLEDTQSYCMYDSSPKRYVVICSSRYSCGELVRPGSLDVGLLSDIPTLQV